MITAYFIGESFFSEDGVNYHQKHYELSDMKSFKVNKETVKGYQVTLSYNLRDNNCCFKVSHVKNGVHELDNVECESVNPLDIATDEVDSEMLRKYVSAKMNIVLNELDKEEIDIPWE